MSEKNKNVDSGVPRPYSNKKLPTPKYIVEEFVNPLNVWSSLLSVFMVLSLAIFLLINYTTETYNLLFIGFSGMIALFAIGISIKDIGTNEINSVPSIKDVSNTIEYVRAASRLSVLTIISGILTTIFILISHTSDIFYFIDDSTRITILIMITLSYIGSYIMVKTLCSYSSIYENSPISSPVKISSLPEIITIIGFIVPPLLVIFTGLIYNGPPIVDVPFSLYLIDTIAILTAIQIFYVSLISRL